MPLELQTPLADERQRYERRLVKDNVQDAGEEVVVEEHHQHGDQTRNGRRTEVKEKGQH